jgi:hypothetical protein
VRDGLIVSDTSGMAHGVGASRVASPGTLGDEGP